MKTPGGPFGAVLAAAAERADVDAFRPAMDGMRPRIAGLPEYLLRLDDLVDLRLGRMRLRIHHVDARGADAGNDQIAPLEEGVAGERRQRRRAGIPAEMVELVALVGHRHGVDDLAVGRRAGLHVDHRERVGLREVRAEQQGVGEFLRRRLHRKFRRRRGRSDQASSSWEFPSWLRRRGTRHGDFCLNSGAANGFADNLSARGSVTESHSRETTRSSAVPEAAYYRCWHATPGELE